MIHFKTARMAMRLPVRGILIDPPPKRFSHRYLARAAVVSYGDSPFPQCLKRGAL
jgi:hypothetical protein